MNANNFSEYIKNPSQLYQISYQELKSLALQYPYCQNLRYLLLQKSKLENHKDFDHNLEMAATYSPDRPFLYNLLKEIALEIEQEDSYLMSDEILELKDLHSLEEIEEVVSEKTDSVKIEELLFTPDEPDEEIIEIPSSPLNEDDDDLLENLLTDEEIESDNLFSVEEPAQNFEKTLDEIITEQELPDDTGEPELEVEDSIEDVIEQISQEDLIEEGLIANMVSHSLMVESLGFDQEGTEGAEEVSVSPSESEQIPFEITNEEAFYDEEENAFMPQPKTSFNSWLKQFESPIIENRFEELLEISKKAKEKREGIILKTKELEENLEKKTESLPKGKKPKELAKESIQEHDDIISETLAQLLEAQGHVQRAIEMYERLSLQNPEKSSSFAAKIEELKKII